LVIGGPQLAVNVVSGHPYTHDIRFHYSSILVAAVFLATVEACARWGRPLVVLVGVSAVAANIAWSPSPVGHDYDTGIWARAQSRHAVVHQALRVVPSRAAVSATYYLVPHLTHRTRI